MFTKSILGLALALWAASAMSASHSAPSCCTHCHGASCTSKHAAKPAAALGMFKMPASAKHASSQSKSADCCTDGKCPCCAGGCTGDCCQGGCCLS